MSDPRARVLVVDDEKLIRWSVSERLARSGYEVRMAESGEQALVELGQFSPDLMVLDVKMSGIDGLETLKRARRMRPDLEVLMMSAHSTVDLAVEAMKEGATDFLVKPFSLVALEAAAARALATHRTREQIQAARGSNGDAAAGLAAIIGTSPAMMQVKNLVQRVAGSDATSVLVEGESGTGKEVVARAIHTASQRAARPMLQVNCAALPDALLESEIFGHERGSFTNAHQQKRGLFELAEGGSVLLDELGELPPGGQAKLLTFMENKTFRRVGGTAELRADVRILGATNVNLEERAAAGQFRADLFFRLNVVRITLPPLREHPEDIPLLVGHFIARFNEDLGRQVRGITPAALDAMVAHPWPGNVRELRNIVERAIILHAEVDELRSEHLPDGLGRASGGRLSVPPAAAAAGAPGPPAPACGLEEAEKRLISEALASAHGNQSQAARLLGISRDTLRYRMKRKHSLL
jgi:DNA-binding NtrC family response regulator